MTFEETKEKLAEIKREKHRLLNLRRDMREASENIDALTLRPSWGIERVQSQSSETTVERLVLRLEALRERFEKQLDRVMDLEDKLFAAIEELTPVEKEIIIGCYLRDKTHKQLSRECFCCVRSVNYLKKQAIEKISSKI